MFVLLPGRSREEAFAIGAEMAAAVTAANPPPVVLKLEKVRPPPSTAGAGHGIHGEHGLQSRRRRHNRPALRPLRRSTPPAC